ncbi:GNAT family acetyltransferase [Xanthomarina sp. F2636L]|uniref:GNAT family acetyltransferase n=1 Tax=Xanthomarina sp. F2636L TaxID=2996018 RepID=UPI00225E1C18|nr:GNAT family acetyltransferase [Xanthomarina sp. F2636L]MCX7552082.1 GNAT family acetyltransferase [Xanthomarina sp. F2636L]
MIKTRIGTKNDINGILSLQEKYLYKNLNNLERKEGFVTTPFTINQIEEIIKVNGVFVAINKENELVAYAFAGSWSYFEQWEIFNFMVSRFPKLSFHGNIITTENSFQYGPVCIDKKYRGKGLLNLIFEEMRMEFLKKYPISITFINKVNVISEKAHTKKLGWEIIDEFEFNNNAYIGLAFNMKHSVLN